MPLFKVKVDKARDFSMKPHTGGNDESPLAQNEILETYGGQGSRPLDGSVTYSLLSIKRKTHLQKTRVSKDLLLDQAHPILSNLHIEDLS